MVTLELLHVGGNTFLAMVSLFNIGLIFKLTGRKTQVSTLGIPSVIQFLRTKSGGVDH